MFMKRMDSASWCAYSFGMTWLSETSTNHNKSEVAQFAHGSLPRLKKILPDLAHDPCALKCRSLQKKHGAKVH